MVSAGAADVANPLHSPVYGSRSSMTLSNIYYYTRRRNEQAHRTKSCGNPETSPWEDGYNDAYHTSSASCTTATLP